MLISSTVPTTRYARGFDHDTARNKVLYLKCITLLVMFLVSDYVQSSPRQQLNPDSALENQQAADFTHIKWPSNNKSSVKILLHPIVNRSGIPLTNDKEKSENFNHSKIPLSIAPLFNGMINSSQYFTSSEQQSDYQLELTIDKYQLPYDYSPDDNWWQRLTGKFDRLFSSAENARVSLSLRISSNKKYIPTWQSNISVSISQCELNKSPQNLAYDKEQQAELGNYLRSAMGQSFVAAGNFLILQAIHYVNNNGAMARVDKVNQNDLLIVAKNNSFDVGEKLALYHNNSYSNQTRLPVGSVQVIKTFENQALAYPVNLSIGSIMEGDWVKVNNTETYPTPGSLFDPVTQCGLTQTDSIVDNSQ